MCHRMEKYLPWQSWIIRVLYMEMTYREPQTPLFPPYVNLVNAKDHRKIGESEHNTDCDVTVGITIVTPPTFAYNRPCSRPAEPAQPSHLKFCRFCEETREHNSKNGRSWNMFQVVQGWVGVCIQNTNSLYTIQILYQCILRHLSNRFCGTFYFILHLCI